MNDINIEEFSKWLNNKSIFDPYAKDIKSRVKRAAKLVDINQKISDESLIDNLRILQNYEPLCRKAF